MPQSLIPASLSLAEDGTPWSERYGDIYHSADGGPGQARQVFLQGNDLPDRWRGKKRFVILETGFGTGLNFLATWAAWCDDPQRPGKLHFLSVEKHPFHARDLATLHGRWPEFAALSHRLLDQWPTLTPGFHRLEFEAGRLVLTLVFGDASTCLPQLRARLDAIYLDGFSPSKNPDLWSPDLFKRLGRLACPGATVATWSVAAPVRQGLEGAGFSTEKRPGFGHKREMLVGRFTPKPWQMPSVAATPPADRRAIVIGAGLAGTACCERLASRGWQVTLIDRHAGPAQEASGNLAGIVMPLVSRDDNIASRLSRAAYLHGLRHWRHLSDDVPDPSWSACGVLQLARDARHEQVQRALAEEMGYPPEYVRFLDKQAAGRQVGQPLPFGGWLFTQGGWAHPPAICALNLKRAGENTHYRFGKTVAKLERASGCWRALDEADALIAEAPVVILASGAEATCLGQAQALPLQSIRGQVSLVPEERLAGLPLALCREGYATPAVHGYHAIGASYDVEDGDPLPRLEDNAGNLARLGRLLPGLAPGIDPSGLNARVGFRAVPPDRLPLVGALPDAAACRDSAITQLREIPRHDGLYAALGYASRGLVWGSLMAELLASTIEGEPLPIEAVLVDAVDPARFLLKQTRRRGL
jgi:tRNA 5-methylaminomethyl-2-thiouridine biosynthesis bifunctional protein